jgi:hypothetical protein
MVGELRWITKLSNEGKTEGKDRIQDQLLQNTKQNGWKLIDDNVTSRGPNRDRKIKEVALWICIFLS